MQAGWMSWKDIRRYMHIETYEVIWDIHIYIHMYMEYTKSLKNYGAKGTISNFGAILGNFYWRCPFFGSMDTSSSRNRPGKLPHGSSQESMVYIFATWDGLHPTTMAWIQVTIAVKASSNEPLILYHSRFLKITFHLSLASVSRAATDLSFIKGHEQQTWPLFHFSFCHAWSCFSTGFEMVSAIVWVRFFARQKQAGALCTVKLTYMDLYSPIYIIYMHIYIYVLHIHEWNMDN